MKYSVRVPAFPLLNEDHFDHSSALVSDIAASWSS